MSTYARQLGEAAAQRGGSILLNPYDKRDAQHAEWHEGWLDEKLKEIQRHADGDGRAE